MKINRKDIQYRIPHVIGLFVIIVLPMVLFNQTDPQSIHWKINYYRSISLLVIVYYVNYHFIVPRYLINDKKMHFVLFLIALSILFLIFSEVLNGAMGNFFGLNRALGRPPGSPIRIFGVGPHIFEDLLMLVLTLGFSTSMAMVKHAMQEESRKKEQEKVHVEMELAFLKNQINPHFFFNSLNNIYSLIAIDGSKAQKAVEALSGLMRYLIYESDVKEVPLHKELAFTRNYIELMEKRLSPKVDLTVDILESFPIIMIPPLLFIPFIENAFKHGISHREKSFISIALKVENEKIIFECKNSIPKIEQKHLHKAGGFGIANIRKRLEIIYGQQADIRQSNEDDIFTITLILPIRNHE